MGQPKLLADAIGTSLKPAGFKKVASTWYLYCDETILVVDLQKSNYGPQYYINIGIWIRLLGDVDKPRESQCHVRMRWESLIPQDEKRLKCLLDLEDLSLTNQEREIEVTTLLSEFVLPFFSIANSISSLRALYNSDSWPPDAAVYAMAKNVLINRDTD